MRANKKRGTKQSVSHTEALPDSFCDGGGGGQLRHIELRTVVLGSLDQS